MESESPLPFELVLLGTGAASPPSNGRIPVLRSAGRVGSGSSIAAPHPTAGSGPRDSNPLISDPGAVRREAGEVFTGTIVVGEDLGRYQV